MRCINCGFVNKDGANFCGYCGAKLIPQPATIGNPGMYVPEPPKKKSKKVPLIIGAAVLAVLLVVFLCVQFLSSPLGLIAVGAKNSVKALSSSELGKTAGAVLNHGSLSVDIDPEQLLEAIARNGGYYGYYGDIGSQLDDSAVNVTLYSALADKSAAVSVDASLDGSALADGMVWVNGDSAGIYSKMLLGNTGYGVDLKKLKEKLPRSIFNPENDSYYALPDGLYDFLMGNSSSTDIEALSKDIKKVAQSAAAVLLKSLNKNADIDRESEKLSFGGVSKSVTAVSISLDERAMTAIIQDVLVWAHNDKELRTLLQDLDKQYGEAFGVDLEDEFYDMIEYYFDEDELEYLLDEFEASFVFYVTKSGKQLVGIDCELESYGDETSFSVKAGPDLSDPDQISVSYEDYWDKISAVYTVKEHDANAYSAKLKIKEGSYELVSGSISWNKKSGDLKISVSDLLELKADMLNKGNATTIEVRSFSYDDGWDEFSFSDPGVLLKVNESAKLPTVPKYTDIAGFTDEGEFEDLITDIEETLRDFLYEIEEQIY